MQLILILALVAVLVVGGVFLVEAWNGQQDAQAQRLAEEARLVRARGEADAARTLASAESASIRADANNRQLAMLFPWLVTLLVAAGFTFALFTWLERRQSVPAQSADVLALAALGRMFLAMQRQERLEVPARAVELAVLDSRSQEKGL